MDFLHTAGPFTAPGLLGLVIFLIVRGQLVPRSQVDAIVAGKDQQIADKNEEITTWREAYAKSEEVRATVADVLRETVAGQKTVLDFIQSLPRRPQSSE